MNRDHWETLAETLVLVIMIAVLCALVWAPPAHSEWVPIEQPPWAEKLYPERYPCTKWCILPPVEFDHPFAGTLKIEIVATRNELREICGPAFRPGVTLGCARLAGRDTCLIVLVQEKIIKEQGWTKELMLRHEIGHCNGWAGDHPGQRMFNAR